MELVMMAATELARVGEGSDTAVVTAELAGVSPNVRVSMGVVAAVTPDFTRKTEYISYQITHT
jgi:hypothetical protein